jgi:cytochrome b561
MLVRILFGVAGLAFFLAARQWWRVYQNKKPSVSDPYVNMDNLRATAESMMLAFGLLGIALIAWSIYGH